MSAITFELSQSGELRLVDSYSHGAAGSCTVLLIIFIIALPLNIAIIIVIFRSFLRAHVFNLLLASFCTAIVLDVATNLPLACVLRASWAQLWHSLGDSLIWLCRFSAGLALIPASLQVMCVVLMVGHRLSAISGASGGPRSRRYAGLSLLIWLLSLSLALPIMAGVQDVMYFDQRYSCSPVNVTQHSSALAVSMTLLTLGHGTPYLLLAALWVVLVWRVLQTRQRLEEIELVAMQRAAGSMPTLMGSSYNSYSSTWQIWGNEHSTAGEGGRFVVLLAVLSTFQLLLVLPGVAVNFATQFLPQHLDLYHPLFTNNRFLPVTTAWYDGTFTWLRIAHSIMAPCAILFAHDPLASQIKENLFLRQQNKYSQLSPVQSVSAFLNFRRTGRRKRKKSKQQKLKGGDTVPILYATTDGIHLRQTASSPSQGSATTFSVIFADLAAKQAGASVKKVAVTPKAMRKIPPNDLEMFEEDEIAHRAKKGGKSVRFAQQIKEIPIGNSPWITPDVSRRNSQIDSTETVADVNPLPDVVSFGPSAFAAKSTVAEKDNGKNNGQYQSSRRGSQLPLEYFSNKKENRSLEMELANSSFNSSSSSLLLTLSQRMRKRDH